MPVSEADYGKAGFRLRSKIWIELNGEVVFGGGRVVLFQAIEQSGSIRQAASQLGQ